MAKLRRRAEMMLEERFNTIALRVQDTLSGLSERDRKLLLGLLGGALLAVIVGGFYAMNSALAGDSKSGGLPPRRTDARPVDGCGVSGQ